MNQRFMTLAASAGKARKETFLGTEYLVVPVTALVEGVIHPCNAPSPELALAEEFGKIPQGWNGRPLTVDHPEVNGQKVSANSPGILESYQFGVLFNTKVQDKKLITEAWLDTNRAADLGGDAQEIVDRLNAGKTIEVSTGLFMELSDDKGRFNSEEYVGTWTNIVPDHLALLLKGPGACSIEDGCGALRDDAVPKEPNIKISNALPGMRTLHAECGCTDKSNCQCGHDRVNIKALARKPAYDGLESTEWVTVSKTFDAYVAGYYAANATATKPDKSFGVKDAPAEIKGWIAERTLLGDPQADTVRDLMMFPVVNPVTNKLNETALKAVLGGVSKARIPGVARHSAQNEARRLLNQEFQANLKASSKLASFLAAAKAKLTASATEISDADLRTALDSALSCENEMCTYPEYAYWQSIVAVFADYFIYYDSNEGLVKRSYTINNDLTVSLGPEDDIVSVNPVTEFIEAPEAADETQMAAMAANKEVKVKTKAEMVAGLVASAANQFTDKDVEFLNTLSEEQLAKMEAPVTSDKSTADGASTTPPKKKLDPASETHNPGDITQKSDASGASADDLKASADTTTKVKIKGKEEDTQNADDLRAKLKSNMSAQEYIADAPAEVREVLEESLKIHASRKNALIATLRASGRCDYTDEELKTRSMAELERFAKLADVKPNFSGRHTPRASADDPNAIPAAPSVFTVGSANKNGTQAAK